MAGNSGQWGSYHGGKHLDLEIMVLMTIVLVLTTGPIIGFEDLEAPR